jgi:hypothetical protein
MAHPVDLGYPWIDPATGLVQFSAATDLGRELLASRIAAAAQEDVSATIRHASRSIADLNAVREGVISLAAEGVPGAEFIAMTEPDEVNGRIVITVSDMSDELMAELAERFDPASIAVRLIAGFRPEASTGGRRADTSPFYGGARIYTPDYTCSSGFSWSVVLTADVPGMLTAGHCVANGGAVSAHSSMGTVSKSSEENWNPGNGTVPFSGQSALAGDLALVRLYSYRDASPRIYRGGPTSSSWDWVTAIWSRSPVLNDQFYVSGQTSGDLGIYSVWATHVDVYYFNLSAWARNMTEGYASFAACPQGGDSGGAVFTNRSDGSVAAKGIHSGSFSDVVSCYEWFTDIRLADTYLPGGLLIH